MFTSLFTFCFRAPSQESNEFTAKQPSDDTTVTGVYRVPGCTFCDVTKEKGFDVVKEDDAFIVFRDHKPAAAQHLLVIPKRHVASVRALKQEDVGLVAQMADIGNGVLDEWNVPQASRRLGFHIPPFNSVQHLHLHVQALPYKSVFRRAKYPIAKGTGGHQKGFSWFAEVGQTLGVLEGGGRVGVFPC